MLGKDVTLLLSQQVTLTRHAEGVLFGQSIYSKCGHRV